MINREFLQLAQTYNSNKHSDSIGGWFYSEKLDGQRAFWDGGITRGAKFQEIPWGNTNRDDRDHTCTGLWSRLGKPIFAPSWFLDKLPQGVTLDGELYVRGMKRQHLASIIKKHVPDPGSWAPVKYYVFDSPRLNSVFMPGRINTPVFTKIITTDAIHYIEKRLGHVLIEGSERMFEMVYKQLMKLAEAGKLNDPVIVHSQVRLPYASYSAVKVLNQNLEVISNAGGEGLMVRKGEGLWYPKRMDYVLKVKKFQDAEGTVKGYYWAEEGKIFGKMGALILDFSGKEMSISGFTDEERVMSEFDSSAAPGSRVREGIFNPRFPIGTVITFKYQDLSEDGIPNHARYWRKHEEG